MIVVLTKFDHQFKVLGPVGINPALVADVTGVATSPDPEAGEFCRVRVHLGSKHSEHIVKGTVAQVSESLNQKG